MIRTTTQLKAKVRNLSGGDSTKAQMLFRNFIMERFLERIALSPENIFSGPVQAARLWHFCEFD